MFTDDPDLNENFRNSFVGKFGIIASLDTTVLNRDLLCKNVLRRVCDISWRRQLTCSGFIVLRMETGECCQLRTHYSSKVQHQYISSLFVKLEQFGLGSSLFQCAVFLRPALSPTSPSLSCRGEGRRIKLRKAIFASLTWQ